MTFHHLRADQKRAIEVIELALARDGCAAAGYRLTGSGLDHFCCVHVDRVTGNWRVIVGFPEPLEVVIIAIGQHDPRGALSIYEDLYGALGLAIPTGRRTKPPCCIEGEPPVNSALLEYLEELAGRIR